MGLDNGILQFLDSAVENYAQHIYDKFIERNIETKRKAGISSVITRRQLGKCCDWCANLVGSYEYTRGNYPEDIFKRHANCRCMVTVKTDRSGYTDVWSKKEYASQKEARIAREYEIKVENAETKHRKAISIAKEKDEICIDAKEYYEEIAYAVQRQGKTVESPIGSMVKIDGKMKTVTGSAITYEPKPGEVYDAKFLSQRLGWNIRVMPEVKVPQHHANPDYYVQKQGGEVFSMDRKGSKLAGDRVFRLIDSSKDQTNRFVVNLTGSELTETEIISQGRAIFKRDRTKFVDQLILIKDNKILAILDKIN